MSQFSGPKGIEPATWGSVYQAAVSSFSGDAQVSRRALYDSAKRICDDFVLRGLTAIVLIDGSFVTNKAFPNDVDLWIFVSDLIAIGDDPKIYVESLHRQRDEAAKEGVDLFVLPVHNGVIVDNLAKSEYDLVTVDWYVGQLETWFAQGRDDEPPKGAYLIKI